MRRFGRRGVSMAGWVRWPMLLAAVTYLLLRVADSMVMGPLALVAETEARLRGIEALNRIVLGTVGQDLKPDDVVIYDRDKTGRIAAYHINTRLVNAVATEAAAAVKDEFREVTSQPVGVPLGALTGNRLLSSTGPRIHVDLIPVGSVVVDIKQEFKAEGINQTRHTISLKATATVRIVLPLATKEVQVSTDVPIADSVIVGEVPQVYGGSVGGVTLPMETLTGR